MFENAEGKFNITVKPGYKLKTISSDDKNLDFTKNGDEYSFIMPNKDIKLKLDVEAEEYHFIERMKSTYKDESLTFKLDGIYSLLDKVYINGKELDKKYYEVKSGSTIITVKKEYLDSLTNGEYKIKATYTNGSEDTTTFKVLNNQVENPKTIDNIMFSIIAGLISIMGLVGTSVLKKKIN